MGRRGQVFWGLDRRAVVGTIFMVRYRYRYRLSVSSEKHIRYVDTGGNGRSTLGWGISLILLGL